MPSNLSNVLQKLLSSAILEQPPTYGVVPSNLSHVLCQLPSCTICEQPPTYGVMPSNLSHVLRWLPSCTICPRVTQSLTNSPICTQLTVKMFLFRHNFYTNEYKLPACVTNSSPETKTKKDPSCSNHPVNHNALLHNSIGPYLVSRQSKSLVFAAMVGNLVGGTMECVGGHDTRTVTHKICHGDNN